MSREDCEDAILVTIRCAFQTAPDHNMDVPLAWTVKELKECIHTLYPSHPAVTSQRLIYCGGCLTDERILRDVFDTTRRVVDGPQVLHLVCPLPQASPEIRRRTTANNSEPVTPTPTPSPAYVPMANWPYATDSSAVSAGAAYAEYYRNYMAYWQQYQAQVAAMNSASYPFPHPVYVQNGPGMPMMPYMAGAGQQGHPVNLTGGANQPVQVQFNVPAAAPQQQAEVNAVNNAVQRRGIGMEEGLELIYKAVRVILLLSAVLLYSSLERFLLVLGIILVIAVTQFRRAQIRRAAAADALRVNNNNAGEQQQQGPEAVNAAVENREDGPDDGGAVRAESGEDEANETASGPDGENMVVAEQAGGVQLFFSTCYTFITSFITSLVPDNIPVDVN